MSQEERGATDETEGRTTQNVLRRSVDLWNGKKREALRLLEGGVMSERGKVTVHADGSASIDANDIDLSELRRANRIVATVGERPSIEQMESDLKAAGWSRVRRTVWKSPDRGYFIGPFGAWKSMKRISDLREAHL